MPLLHGRVTNKTYEDILDRVDTRLLGCNAKHLSFTKKAYSCSSGDPSIVDLLNANYKDSEGHSRKN